MAETEMKYLSINKNYLHGEDTRSTTIESGSPHADNMDCNKPFTNVGSNLRNWNLNRDVKRRHRGE
ncbi:hypothetical protein SESBI_04065 [Sesbania bispinosa]|nr:hypothetical protein SESBI_04065 [Sesbania bispinosa]